MINGADTAVFEGNIQDSAVITLPYICCVYYLV